MEKPKTKTFIPLYQEEKKIKINTYTDLNS